MWADFETVEFLKFGSIVEKLFNMLKNAACAFTPYAHKNNVKKCSNGIFEHK